MQTGHRLTMKQALDAVITCITFTEHGSILAFVINSYRITSSSDWLMTKYLCVELMYNAIKLLLHINPNIPQRKSAISPRK